MRKDVNLLYGQVVVFVILLFTFLISGDTLALFVSLGVLGTILLLVFRIKNYNPKIYSPLVTVPIFIFQGLILVYTYLFRSASLEDPKYRVLFYFFVAVFIVMIYFYIYYYRKNCTKEYYE
ncbi:MAG: hypothetical protein ACP5C3_07050 [Methanomicrobiales archaeon]